MSVYNVILTKGKLHMKECAINPSFLFLPAAFCGMSTRWKCVLTTIWTSSAPTTPTARCHHMQLSAMCSTWWRRRTTKYASLTPLTSSAGSARGLLLRTLRRNSLRNSSVLPPSPWERSSDKERAIIISVSVSFFFKGFSYHFSFSFLY